MTQESDEKRYWHEADEPNTAHGLEANQSDGSEVGGLQASDAPNTSMETGAGSGSTGYDSPPIGSIALSNPQVEGVEHEEPYYPPGGADGSVSEGEDTNESEEREDRHG